MRATILAVLAMALASCTDEDDGCLHESCKGDPEETRTFSGPCTAATSSFVRDCRFEYDAALRVAGAACISYGGFEDELEEDRASYQYDDDGRLVSIETFHKMVGHSDVTAERWTWRWSRSTVDVSRNDTVVRQYDRSRFALYPATPIERAWPKAELGLLRSGDVTFTWSRSGNTLTRTSSTGEVAVFTVDDKGRLIEGGGASFTYDGDRLVSRRAGRDLAYIDTFHYDRGGNLIETTEVHPEPYVEPRIEVYDYRCWDNL